MTKPNLFIVGAPKCGTSSMYEYLSQHPEIYMSAVKEPKHFCPDLNSKTNRDDRVFTTGLAEYLHLFEAARNEKWRGEATALYMFSETAAQNIFAFNPEARIIIMIRNPIDAIYAFHAERLYNGNENIESFQTALEQERERAIGKNLPPTGAIHRALQYREVVQFSDQINRFLTIFPRSQIHFVLFDDLKVDTPKEYQRVLEFLRVETNFRPSFEIKNSSKRHQSRIVKSLIRNREGILMSTWRNLIPSKIRKQLSGWVISKTTSKRKALDPSLRSQLEEEFESEIAWLSDFFERDFSDWIVENRKRQLLEKEEAKC